MSASRRPSTPTSSTSFRRAISFPWWRRSDGARKGKTLNINADTFAGALASALKAKRLLMLTDVDGVLDTKGKLIEQMAGTEARALIANGVVSGGMIPKVETCIAAVEEGVEGVVIINGKVPHAVLLELFTEHGAGHADRLAIRGAQAARPALDRDAMQTFAETRCWIFDLDNTLYPAECNLFAQVDQRMGDFIADFLGVPFEEARRLQKGYYLDYGTTLAGLMTKHGLEPSQVSRLRARHRFLGLTPSP